MANIKVSEMTEATVFDDGDYTMIVQGNQNKKIAKENMLQSITDNIGEINETIDTINTNISNITGQILWTNLAPTSNFNAQTITLNSSDYDCYEVIYKRSTNALLYMSTGKIPKSQNINLITWVGEEDNAYLQMRWRTIEYVNDTSLSVPDCTSKLVNANTGNVNNQSTIPLYVIGYKTGLFS